MAFLGLKKHLYPHTKDIVTFSKYTDVYINEHPIQSLMMILSPAGFLLSLFDFHVLYFQM